MSLPAEKGRCAPYGNYICHTFQGGSWADRSPLHDAAFQGRLLSLKTLIAQGFNVNLVTTDRVSALHEACLGGHVACAKLLLENGAQEACCKGVKPDYPECVLPLQVNAATIDGITPLFNACCSGSAACVNMLLEFGAKAQLGTHLPSPIHEAVKRGHRECMETLLAHAVDIDQEDPQHGTPLYMACSYQRTECVKKLLELGANVNMGKRLDTPLHMAARKSSVEIVVLLTDYGANPKCKNADLKCALDLATPHSKVEQVLLLREGPASLAQLCRLCIRRHLGRSCLYTVHRLHLPEPLENFLLYR
ncbi:ankyrin repeat and SOCS box protein 11 isoform X3 [Poecile atricapillus]|uniref:ankyrin repeat and SOCS box protein 11 isoform X3 n=1 Tax=Poecile atricapillus TaxID=48891 RepID=UPI0027389F75|nr:ankyrin repeat and SOCS box protein 11 isoform X3 [Poecile atricapillus]